MIKEVIKVQDISQKVQQNSLHFPPGPGLVLLCTSALSSAALRPALPFQHETSASAVAQYQTRESERSHIVLL